MGKCITMQKDMESEVNLFFFRKSGMARAEMDFKMNSITH